MTVYYQPGYRPDNNRGNTKSNCNCGCGCGNKRGCPENRVDCSPDKVIFRCNNLTGASGVSIISIGDTVPPRTVGSVSVSDLCCFKRPCVKVDVTAVINFSAAIALGTTITFRVFKRCVGEDEVEIQSYDFSQGIALLAGSSIPVSFSVCDCTEGCSDGCCTYRVTVEATAEVALGSAINVNQGTISVIGTDMC